MIPSFAPLLLPLLVAAAPPALAQARDASPLSEASAASTSTSPSSTGGTAAPAPAPSATAAFYGPVINVRRGPATAPRMIRGDATIRNSGSTNGEAYTIVVRSDFTADVTVGSTSERKTIAAPQGRWLFAKLREAMPLDSLGTGRCMKSVSFGSSTTISYDGRTSPDLSCAGDAVARELHRTVTVIAGQLNIQPFRKRTLREP